MAVYREGYDILKQYEAKKSQIWNDACDEGVVINIGDKNSNALKQLVDWYGDKATRKVSLGVDQISAEIQVTLMDEWAVSDGRKTLKQATELYQVSYYKFRKSEQKNPSLIKKGYEGFYSITKIN